MKIGHELVTSGPYHFVRHPIYTGVLTALFGSGLVDGPIWMVVFLSGALTFIWRIRVEESLYDGAFPGPISGISRKDEGADSCRMVADGGATTLHQLPVTYVVICSDPCCAALSRPSPTILLYGKNRQAPDLLVGDFAGAFTNADGML